MNRKTKRRVTQTQFIALGFFIMILVGTLLLMLPVSSRTGKPTDFLTAGFTATSASCVTGLTVADTYQYWSVFGQLVILSLIQIGGLGFITIGVLFAMILRRRINLKTRGLIQESVNSQQIGGVVRLVRKIIKGTILFEGIGVILLSIRFIPKMGVAVGIYNAVFHAISAFCNAGFDLMGRYEEYSSFCRYYNDWLVNLVLMALIIIGGIGFIVWDDISQKKWRVRTYRLHTKIVLLTTGILIFGGTALFYFLEKDNLLAGMPLSDKILTSLFSSVTPRTAGFNTIDTSQLSVSGKILTIILMFIGGGTGSTAGGIKTTTVAILAVSVWSYLKRTEGSNIFGRRLEEGVIREASTVFSINLFLPITAAIWIAGIQAIPMEDILFEVFSAIGTAGMTTGITRQLSDVSRMVIMFLMYCGRIGSLSFAMSFNRNKVVPKVRMPAEKVRVG